MTIASLLLAFCTAATAASSDSASPPVLLDFHAEWCGPCKTMRPIIRQLIKKEYPVRSIDYDHDPDGFVQHYHVQDFPTFIVVDSRGRELDRIKGACSATALAKFYNEAAAKAESTQESIDRVEPRSRPRSRREDREADEESAPKGSRNVPNKRTGENAEETAEEVFTNPKPWESSVRIRVVGPHSTGFGSGTIIYSTPEESLILTCAHIFHIEGVQKQPSPAKFPRQIVIDLFDGKLKKQGNQPVAKVSFVRAVEGKAVDYDFTRDVGLIRIRTGGQLPSSRVVPAYWEPKARMSMVTVGCSEGDDATAWSTVILEPRRRNFLQGRPAYEAIECVNAPKQGRSGGGLFTDNGYIAGVCDFAEPQGKVGLYATPRSIYTLLDRNNLMALYSPPSLGSGTLVADRSSNSRSQPPAPRTVARSQSPDREEAPRDRTGTENRDVVMIPDPPMLGIPIPVVSPEENAHNAPSTSRRTNWRPTRRPSSPNGEEASEPVDPPAEEPSVPKQEITTKTEKPSPPSSDSTTGSPSKAKWRAVKSAPVSATTTDSVN